MLQNPFRLFILYLVITNWLQAFGIEHFVTEMPGDLEYDPQLSVVAEWRDGATLLKNHIDNAVMNVLLEKADAGMSIRYDWWQLPLARCLKGWSMLKNLFGKPAIIPEGMAATQALKNQYFVKIYTRSELKRLYRYNHFDRPIITCRLTGK